jgi:cytochrome c
MKTVVLAVTLLLFSFCAFASEDAPTKDDAKALVKIAVAYAKSNDRAKFFNEVSSPSGQFHFKAGTKKGLYIFVYDDKGVVLAHGDRQDVIGKNRWNDKDPDGKYWVRDWTALVKKSGSGWITYKQFNPADKRNMGVKSSFVELHDGMIIGCGVYVK